VVAPYQSLMGKFFKKQEIHSLKHACTSLKEYGQSINVPSSFKVLTFISKNP